MKRSQIKNFLKPTIPEANHRGLPRPRSVQVSPVSSRLPSGTEILYFTSPRTAENGSSDLSQGEVNRKPRPKGRRIFRLSILMVIIIGSVFFSCVSTKNVDTGKEILPVPSNEPNKAQLKQIERKYGMFIHFGINTFHDMEWTDGSKPAMSYNPTEIDADQWILTAKNAGMKYVILITKHHDGFCLWDSKYTEYDVANSGNKTNVVEAVAKACEKYGIGLGLYYSLWDRNRNGDLKNTALDSTYNSYMIKQLDELMEITKKHTNIVEFWFDGGWLKENNRWPIKEIYQTIKSKEPECLIGVNWSIGLPENADHHPVLPKDQKEGYPIRYFPSDFRLGDPYLPVENDPKLFSHKGKEYYMPWESTICISEKWFYNTTDTTFKPIDELVDLYKVATAQDNILILNCPPNREGKIRDRDIEVLNNLKEQLEIGK